MAAALTSIVKVYFQQPKNRLGKLSVKQEYK